MLKRLAAILVATTLTTLAAVAPASAYQGDTYEELIQDETLTDQHAIVIRFYAAVLGRTPDNDGVRFWLDQYDTGEWSTRRIANFFATSDEFKGLYGENTTNSQFVDSVYPNVLGREPDETGRAFWIDYLDKGNARAEMILLISNATEFIDANPLPFDNPPVQPGPEPTPDPAPTSPSQADFIVSPIVCDAELNIIDLIECHGTFKNPTNEWGFLVVRVAFLDESGLRLESEGRFRDYVAPNEEVVFDFFGPPETASAQILEIEIDAIEAPYSNGPPIDNGRGEYLLPIDTSIVEIGDPQLRFGSQIFELRIKNTGPIDGQIVTTVVFLDGNGLRIDGEARFERSVPQGAEFLQDFFGPEEAESIEVREVTVEPE